MTVLIGLRCRDGVVLACDSHETRVNYSRSWPKVDRVDDNFVVLGAGNLTLSEAFSRRLQDKFREGQKEEPVKQDRIIQSLLNLAQEMGEAGVKERQFLISEIRAKYAFGQWIQGERDENMGMLWVWD